MSRTRIKICGLREPEDIAVAVRSGVDAIGLVFVAASPRSVGVEEAASLVRLVPPFIETVGLFVDMPPDVVVATAKTTGIRTAQLHGHESTDIVAPLRDAGLRVIKAIPADEQLEDQARRWADHADALMVDTPPQATGLTGGSGESFDWGAFAALPKGDLPPLILAGGLTPENVGRAIAQTKPYAVDVSSGVESRRGVKDAHAIARFAEAVREADAGVTHH